MKSRRADSPRDRPLPSRDRVDEAEFLTIKEAAARYKISSETIRIWIRNGDIPYVRVGPQRIIRLRRRDMERDYGTEN